MAFNENTRVKLPAILHLCRLGYTYVPLSKATWDLNTNIFTDIFLESVGKLNPERTADEIKRALEEVTLTLDNEDLGQAFYKLLTSGTGVKLFDFKDPAKNSYHVVTELTYKNGEVSEGIWKAGVMTGPLPAAPAAPAPAAGEAPAAP